MDTTVGSRAAGFQARATAPGKAVRVVATSWPLEWPPLIPPAPEPELVDAARAVAQALVDAGWTSAGRDDAWYAAQFVWTHADAPEVLGPVEPAVA